MAAFLIPASLGAFFLAVDVHPVVAVVLMVWGLVLMFLVGYCLGRRSWTRLAPGEAEVREPARDGAADPSAATRPVVPL